MLRSVRLRIYVYAHLNVQVSYAYVKVCLSGSFKNIFQENRTPSKR